MILDLEPMKVRRDAATAGPWETDDGCCVQWYGDPDVVVTEIGRIHEPEDCDFVVHARQDVDDLIAEVERLRIDLEHAENEHSRLSYEARIALARYGQHSASCERLMGAGAACSCGLGVALEMLPVTLSDLIRQIEARGWLWEAGQLTPDDERGRYYARLRTAPRWPGSQNYGYGYGASVEEAIQQAIAAMEATHDAAPTQ